MNQTIIGVGVLVCLLGCGAKVQSEDSGGKTNWLSPCEQDRDCRSLEDAVCADRKCTPRCEVESCEAVTDPVTDDTEDPTPDTEDLTTDSDDPTPDTEPAPDITDDTESATDDTDTSTPLEICDGSDEVRFFSTTGGGFVDEYYPFYGRYGRSFLAIDGQCRYWVSDRAGTVRTGVLDPQEAREFAPQLHFDQLDDFAGYTGVACVDGGSSLLRDPSGESSCFCQCNAPDAPEGYADAYGTARFLAHELFALGEELTGPARLLIVLDETLSPQGPGVPWPLAFDPSIQSFEYQPDLGSDQVNPEVGLLITDPEELMLLRSSRQLWFESSEFRTYFPPHLHMTHSPADAGTEAHFRVFMSDELPERILAQFER